MSKFTLLNSIVNEADEQDEGGFLANFKKSFKSASAPKEKKDGPADKNAPPKKEKRAFGRKNDTALFTLASRIKAAPNNAARVVLRTSKTNLDKNYTNGSDGSAFIDAMTDDEVKTIARSPEHPENVAGKKVSFQLQVMPKGYKLSSLAPGNEETITLIDAPINAVNELKAAGKANNIQAAREALKKMMDHDHFVATLNAPHMKARAEKLDAAQDDNERLINSLNPFAIIIYYADEYQLTTLKDEWNERVMRYQGSHGDIGDTKQAASEKQPDEQVKGDETKADAEQKPADQPAAPTQQATAEPPPPEEKAPPLDELTASLEDTWARFSKGMVSKDGKINLKKYNALDAEKRQEFNKKLFALRKQLDAMASSLGTK